MVIFNKRKGDRNMNLKTTADLRRVLSETLQGVRDDKIGSDKAQAIAQLCTCIVRSADLDLRAMRYAQRYSGNVAAISGGTQLIEEVAQ